MLNYQTADFVASYGLSSQLPAADRPEIAFSGRSNVGKSSLINKLCSRKNLARVSATPGKTATLNFYSVDGCYLVDLPGYGFAKVSNADRQRWNDLIDRYFAASELRCTLLVQLLDARHAPSAEDRQMLQYLQYHRIPYVIALTKADKLKKSELTAAAEQFRADAEQYGCKAVLLTSAENGLGVESLREWIDRACARNRANGGTDGAAPDGI
jgi:GTP-binding protein